MDLVVVQMHNVLSNQSYQKKIMGNHNSLGKKNNLPIANNVGHENPSSKTKDCNHEISEDCKSSKFGNIMCGENGIENTPSHEFVSDNFPSIAFPDNDSEQFSPIGDVECEVDKIVPLSPEEQELSKPLQQNDSFDADKLFDEIDFSSNTSSNESSQTTKELSVRGLYSHRSLRRMCRGMGITMRVPPQKTLMPSSASNVKFPKSFSAANSSKFGKASENDDSDSSTVEYEIESIVDYSFEKGVQWYLVKWKNWSSAHNTWEPESHLDGCEELMEEFHSSKYNRKRKGVSLTGEVVQSKKMKISSFIADICKKSSDSDLAVLLKLGKKTMSTFSNTKKDLLQLKTEIRDKYVTCSREKQNRNIKSLLEEESIIFGDLGLLEYAKQREGVLQRLKAWEKEMNEFYENSRIVVENSVDLEGPPKDFTYITTYIPGDGVQIPDDPLLGCQCKDCFQNPEQCCPGGATAKFAYNKNGLVSVPAGSPIYECNKLCACGENCANRVVQKGQKINVIIFRTDDGRGWGVKSTEKIKKGTFVMEYNGEVITSDEAERRGTQYDGEGRTYLFDLDYDGSDTFTVDAAFFGNAAHFINHSCNPNLHVYGVWVDHLDTRIPRVAFFARREIKKYEELTFDYRMTTGSQSPKKVQEDTPSAERSDVGTSSTSGRNLYRIKPIQCKCGSSNCRQFLF